MEEIIKKYIDDTGFYNDFRCTPLHIMRDLSLVFNDDECIIAEIERYKVAYMTERQRKMDKDTYMADRQMRMDKILINKTK